MEMLTTPVLMAPMAGVTDAPFRRRLRRNGARMLFTEMVSAAALARANRRTLAYLFPSDLGPDLGVQLFGARPEELTAAAALVQDAGFRHVDLNMGCPVRKVIRSGAGAALMLDPGLAARCLAALRREVRGVLTVKIRLGWDAGHLNAEEIGRVAVGEGIDFVIVHGRTRAQGYSGRADWEAITALAQRLPLPVVGNGDMGTADEVVTRLRTCGVAGVMIGRAALARPWVFGDALRRLEGLPDLGPPCVADRGRDLVEHLDDLEAEKGGRVAVFEARKFVAWACHGLTGAAEFRRRIQGLGEMSTLRSEVARFFGEARLTETGGTQSGREPDEDWSCDACDAA